MKKFKVWYPENGDEDDAISVMANDPDDAAIIWAQRADSDSADYWIVGGQTPVVHVRCTKSGRLTLHRVRAEQSIIYLATEVTLTNGDQKP